MELRDFIRSNNDKGLKLDYLTEEGLTKSSVQYDYGPYIHFEDVSDNHTLMVAVICTVGVMTLGLVGWYIFIQVKRYREVQQRGRLISPLPREIQEMPYQGIVIV